MAKRTSIPTPGSIFNRMTFLADFKVMYGEWYGFFQCSCGKKVERRIKSVVNGYTKSCGCYKTELLQNNPRRRKQATHLKTEQLHG